MTCAGHALRARRRRNIHADHAPKDPRCLEPALMPNQPPSRLLRQPLLRGWHIRQPRAGCVRGDIDCSWRLRPVADSPEYAYSDHPPWPGLRRWLRSRAQGPHGGHAQGLRQRRHLRAWDPRPRHDRHWGSCLGARDLHRLRTRTGFSRALLDLGCQVLTSSAEYRAGHPLRYSGRRVAVAVAEKGGLDGGGQTADGWRAGAEGVLAAHDFARGYRHQQARRRVGARLASCSGAAQLDREGDGGEHQFSRGNDGELVGGAGEVGRTEV